MGCWNKTCGLSNLHIYAGTPVYVFLLEEARDDSNCYTTSLFSPLLLPFESEYNDYGGGENSSGVAFNLIMDSLKQNLFEMPLGDNEYHDIAVTKEAFGEELFFEATHENRLFIQSRFSQEKTAVTFTMFRKDIMDEILEKRVIEEYVGAGKGTFAKYGDEKNYVRYNFKDIVADIKPMIDIAVEKIAKAKAENDTFATYMLFDGIEGIFDWNCENKAARWMRHDSHRYSRIVDMKTVFRKGIEAGTPQALEKLAEVLEQHLKALFIEDFMNATRKTWIPGGHEGSQGAGASAYRLLANSILTALDREKAEWLEENEGDEEEYEES